jgi:hypothetical protein
MIIIPLKSDRMSSWKATLFALSALTLALSRGGRGKHFVLGTLSLERGVVRGKSIHDISRLSLKEGGDVFFHFFEQPLAGLAGAPSCVGRHQ